METALGRVGVVNHDAAKAITLFYLGNTFERIGKYLGKGRTYGKQMKEIGWNMTMQEVSTWQ